MAQDATGTPTSLGIPTYNVNQDAPTGNGFNAAMSTIDTLIKARVLDPTTQTDGEPLVWDTVSNSWKPVHVKVNDNTKYLRGDGTWQTISFTGQVPTGALSMYAAVTAPTGWLLCDGAAVSRTTYATLFGVISTAYGVGDGTTTFNVPDMRGRVPAGYAPTGGHLDVSAMGASDGVAVANRRPKHRHTPHTHTYGDQNGAGGLLAAGNNARTTTSQGAGSAFEANDPASADGGSGNANDSLDAPAYLVVNYIIKT